LVQLDEVFVVVVGVWIVWVEVVEGVWVVGIDILGYLQFDFFVND